MDVLDDQKRYYAARAPEYDDWWYKRGRYEVEPEVLARWHADIAEVDAALAKFAPSGSVLELAAGTGLWTRKLVRIADRVVAVDANREPLALNTDEAELVVADVFAWEPAEAFDVVFFGFWLSHVPEERFADFWRTVRSALAPGGRVFLVDSGPRETEPGDDRQVRQLADGREFRIVKKFWRPAELAERVRPIGFELDVRLTANGNFLYGFGS